MMRNLISLAAGAALVALSGTAYAEQPLPVSAKKLLALSDKQMDRVSAGSTAIANATGLSIGEVLADTYTQTSTSVIRTGPPAGSPAGTPSWVGQIVWGGAFSQSAVAGGFLVNTLAAAHADTAATW
jgi:hypothetical protein